MLDRMQRLKRAVSRQLAQKSAPDRARAARENTLRLMVEGLETRVVMATVTWAGSGAGGIWELPGNWDTGKVPTAADDVVINLSNAKGAVQVTRPGDAALSLTTNSTSAVQINNGGTFALGGGNSSISGGITGTAPNQSYTGGIQIVPGATMTVAAKATVALNNAQITDQGTLTVAQGASFTFSGGQMTPGGITVTGVFTTSGSTYTGGSYTGVNLYSPGRLFATNNTFNISGADVGVFIASNATLAPTDLTGNDFSGTSLVLPSTYVPLVTNNKAFGQVDLYDGYLPSGTALTLPKMGTVSTANIYYRFLNGYVVAPGASLVVDPNLRLEFTYDAQDGLHGTSFVVQAGGQAFLNQGDTVQLYTHTSDPQRLEGYVQVDGFLSSNGVTYQNIAGTVNINTIYVEGGSTFLATNNLFNVNNVDFDPDSLAGANSTTTGGGVVTGNDFSRTQVTIYALDLPKITNNLEFNLVRLKGLTPGIVRGSNQPLELTSALELTAMGTRSAANLIYFFVDNVTIDAGASLTIDPGVRLNLFNDDSRFVGGTATPDLGRTINVDGTLNVGAGALIRMDSTPPDTSKTPPVNYPQGVSQIVVNDGGTMNTTGASFITLTTSLATNITANAGGHIVGSGNDFAPTNFVLNSGAILAEDGTDLTNNVFAFTRLTLPSDYLARITNNRQFSQVGLTTPAAGGVTDGETLALTAMGTVTSSTLSYFFLQDFTIQDGGTVIVAANLPVTFGDYTQNFGIFGGIFLGNLFNLTDDGTFTLAAGNSLAAGDITVGDGTAPAALNAPGATFNVSSITVNNNASFATVGAAGYVSALTFGPGSTASLTVSNLSTVLSVDGTTNETITGNNFFNSRVVATGSHDATPTIQMGGNYWGSTDPAVIRATRVFDFYRDSDLPEVILDPIIGGIGSIVAAPATAVYGSAQQTVTLTASVLGTVFGSVTAPVDRGTVTIGVYDGATLIGQEQQVAVTNGAVSVQYTIPAFLAVGVYSIHATYTDSSNKYLSSIDTSHYLTITKADATLTTPSGSNTATYNANAAETATLTANVAGVAGPVSEGTVTFTVFTTGDTPTQVGVPITVAVVNGVATATISLPAGTPAGTFTLNTVFNGSNNYTATDVVTGTLTVLPAPTSVQAFGPTVTYTAAAQSISLSAQVTSTGGAVADGTMTFTLVVGTTAIGTPITVNVVNGMATGTYTLPAGTLAGSYAIQAVYTGTGNFAGSSSTASLVTIARADTATVATSRSLAYNPVTGAVALSAAVTSLAGTVNEGSVTFQVFNGTTLLGAAVSGAVSNGVATANYLLPGGLEVGTTYTIVVRFDGSPDYLASADSASSITRSGTLTIVQATPIMGVGADAGVYSPQGEIFGAHALVLVGSAPVTEGTVTFTVYSGTTAIAASAAVALDANGRVDVPINLPAGTPAGGAYTIVASYSGSGRYIAQSATNAVTINKATPALGWNPPADIVYGTPLTGGQLGLATFSSVPGMFTYSPPFGTVLNAGGGQVLTATFTPADGTDYNGGTISTTINVVQAVPFFGFLTASQVAAYAQPTIAVTGLLAAGSAVPVGATVSVSIQSGLATTTAVATVNADGTFTANVPLNGLNVGAYAIRYSFAGDGNFAPAADNSTVLNVVRAPQAITTFLTPISAVYGTTFHVNVGSSSGLPVALTATNASVVANPLGGYDVTMLSGTNAAILVASVAGDGNYTDATPLALPVAAIKAQAAVALANLGIYTDSGPHPVSASTNPAGLSVPITYTLNGVPVAVPSSVGTYDVSATINDPNYQGTSSGKVLIVSAGGGATPVVGPVAVSAVTTALNKQKAVTSINLTFNGDLAAGSAANLGNYRLAAAGKGGSFTAKNARTFKIKSASYNAATHTVTLVLNKAQRIGAPTQLRVYGGPGTGLVGANGQFIDGNRDGVAGGDETAIIRKGNRITF